MGPGHTGGTAGCREGAIGCLGVPLAVVYQLVAFGVIIIVLVVEVVMVVPHLPFLFSKDNLSNLKSVGDYAVTGM